MTHVHHWRIAEPDGRTYLPAVCRGCGAVREFPATDRESRQFNNQRTMAGLGDYRDVANPAGPGWVSG